MAFSPGHRERLKAHAGPIDLKRLKIVERLFTEAATSEADTRVMVDDGQTAVIGGLIRTDEANVRRGVPIVKDIPL